MILASQIAAFFHQSIQSDFEISSVNKIEDQKQNSLCFIEDLGTNHKQFLMCPNMLVLANTNPSGNFKSSILRIDNPKKGFSEILYNFGIKSNFADIFEKASLPLQYGVNLVCGNNLNFSGKIIIGNNVTIGNNVVLTGPLDIGDNTSIGNGTVIGSEGFGFTFEESNVATRFPHMGKVIIGSHVEIGDQCHIAKGSIQATMICDHVKINAQTRIAHNVYVGAPSILCSCSISGSSSIGEDCWIAPGAIVRNKVNIGDGTMVGLGAVVTKSFGKNLKVFGNPAETR